MELCLCNLKYQLYAPLELLYASLQALVPSIALKHPKTCSKSVDCGRDVWKVCHHVERAAQLLSKAWRLDLDLSEMVFDQ
jgi:hypothetical protein